MATHVLQLVLQRVREVLKVTGVVRGGVREVRLSVGIADEKRTE